VQSLHIKTSASVSLPIWSCDLGVGESGRWTGLVRTSEGSKASESAENESEESEREREEEEPAPVQKDGKKRAAGGVPAAATAGKKVKTGLLDATNTTKTSIPSSKLKTATASKPIPASASQSSTKKSIPRTPFIEESSSDEELEAEPEQKAKSKSTSEVKKKAATASGIEQKKAKILAAKGLTRGGSKARITGTKSISR
jgi:ribosome biogenesis protein UTP30